MPAALAAPSCGLYGKLPARGDFVRSGLPTSFTDPWDEWWQVAIPDSRTALGEDWLSAWLEAPIWRFALPDGACGPAAVLGLWMPSVDRVGRHFPLTLACLMPGAVPGALAAGGTDWLDHAEQAGIDALDNDLTQEAVMARLLALPGPLPAEGASGDGQARWWTAGSPFVAAGGLRVAGLPEPAQLATMIREPTPSEGMDAIP